MADGLAALRAGTSAPASPDERSLLHRVWDEIWKDRVGAVAAACTFYIVLALFPALATLVSLYGVFADPATMERHLATLSGLMPESMIGLMADELRRLTASRVESLGLTALGGLLFALWSANNGALALIDALNVVSDAEEKRSYLKVNLVALVFTLSGIVFAVIILNAVVGVPLLVNVLHLGPAGELLVAALPAVVLYVVATLAIASLYRYGPCRAARRWRRVAPGALVAGTVWLITSAAFSWYLGHWNNYSSTYGALGTVIGAMMWIYISMWIVLIGAELNVELDARRKARSGPPHAPRPSPGRA